MSDIYGYWVMVTLCCLPLVMFPVFVIGDYLNDLVIERTNSRHKLKWFAWLWDVIPAPLFMIGFGLGILEWVIFLVSTFDHLSNPSKVHVYISLVDQISTALAPLAEWLIGLGCIIAGLHYSTIGYANVLNMSDKIKDEEKKDV